uniref:Cytochrome-c oxidase n=1 Tax=Caenorhabditis tropicalis TaxID=1561998 RepID=A0A1I7T7P6_9PELO
MGYWDCKIAYFSSYLCYHTNISIMLNVVRVPANVLMLGLFVVFIIGLLGIVSGLLVVLANLTPLGFAGVSSTC